ncbi:MAG: GMC family oxidoreductase N-terminal domain-containing protein [Azospirillaceae bacterium]
MTASFDVLIVGAGSAGSVLAARLSEDPHLRVGVIEAGGMPDDPDIADPLKWALLQGRSYDWAYETVPQRHTAGRVHSWPRGRLVGGSSCLHAMAHVRGHPADFDAWAEAGGERWRFAALLPFFRKSEDFLGPPSDLHGRGGPLTVDLASDRVSDLTKAYMAASESIGIDPSGDHNGPRMEGAAANSLTISAGRRQSVADAYLLPVVRDRPNLTLLTGRLVDHVLIERGRATGVVTVEDGHQVTYRAERVILSAGAVASPLILMRSGIGPAGDLARHGIGVAIDNPAVGGNLHDHLLGAGNVYRARQPLPASRLQHSESLLYHGGDGGSPKLVLTCVLLPVVTEAFTPPPVGAAYTIMFGVCQPKSRGRLSLGGRDPATKPVIDPAYLSEAEDRAAMREALELARAVGHAAPLDPWREQEALPGPAVRDAAALDAFIGRASMTHHHPVGTCAMGRPGRGVVDGDLAVQGVAGLSIVDASVIPRITSGPVNAAIVAMAEAFAASWQEGD